MAKINYKTLRKKFIETYSEDEALRIEESFDAHFDELLSKAEPKSKRKLKENREAFLMYLLNKVGALLIPTAIVSEENPLTIRDTTNNLLDIIFLFPKLTMIALFNCDE